MAIQHGYEPCRIALRGNVHAPSPVAGADNDERRSPDERDADVVQPVDDLADRGPFRGIGILQARPGEHADDEQLGIELTRPRALRDPGHARGRGRLAERALEREGRAGVEDLLVGDRLDAPA